MEYDVYDCGKDPNKRNCFVYIRGVANNSMSFLIRTYAISDESYDWYNSWRFCQAIGSSLVKWDTEDAYGDLKKLAHGGTYGNYLDGLEMRRMCAYLRTANLGSDLYTALRNTNFENCLGAACDGKLVGAQ